MAKPSGLDPEDSEGSTPSIRTICARSPIGRGIRFKPCTVWIRIPPGVLKIGNGKDTLQCVPYMPAGKGRVQKNTEVELARMLDLVANQWDPTGLGFDYSDFR